MMHEWEDLAVLVAHRLVQVAEGLEGLHALLVAVRWILWLRRVGLEDVGRQCRGSRCRMWDACRQCDVGIRGEAIR